MVSQRINCEKSGKTVKIEAVSARRLKLTPMYKGGEIFKDGKLVGLDFDGEFGIKAGEVLNVQRQRYQIQSFDRMLTESGHCCGYYLNTSMLNKSSMFIIPFLGFNRAYFRWNFEFMNCFIATEALPVDGHIYLWYKYTGSQEMEEFEAKIKQHPNYVSMQDVDDYHVLYKFSVPNKFLKDYDLIIQGKYSYISEVSKERILNFHSSAKDRPLGKILYRDAARRKRMEEELGTVIPKELDLHDPLYEEDEYFFDRYRIPKATL